MRWTRENTPRGRAILAAVDSAFGMADLDDDLLAALASRWTLGL